MSFWKKLFGVFRKVEVAKEDYAHLRLLALLQKSRLIDFLKEDISKYSDAQVGSAVRKIHSDCGKILEEYITLRPLITSSEGESFTVPSDYNPAEIKVTGKVKGGAPYKGILRHKGWKAHKLTLPQNPSQADVIFPAEVEVI